MNTGPFWDYVLEKGINTKRKMVKRYSLGLIDERGFDQGDGGGNGFHTHGAGLSSTWIGAGLASCGLGRGTVSM